MAYVVNKIFILTIIGYVYLLSLYAWSVFYGHNSKKIAVKNFIKKSYIIIFIVTAFLVLLLPLEFYYDGEVVYSYGISTTCCFIGVAILITTWIICLFLNVKNAVQRKLYPLWLFAIMSSIIMFLRNSNPELTLISSTEALIVFLMYFTIENPDVKMIQQLEVAREQADKANRAKTDFLSSMSHEIRTPLNAIVGFSDCIADAKSLGEAQENAKDIVNASQTLLEIVNGILDISKIEAGKIEIVNTKYNAPETFEELAKLITPKMNEKGLDFSYSIAPDLPLTLFGDHANIKKIVTNLLSNACKYTDRGFVHYEVNCVNTKNVSKLIISVEDSGRGIKKDSVDKMFTKFQRLEEDKNTTIEGTGLGLAITKQLIELMGGRIILHTVYGQGSKFTVVLNQRITEADAETSKKVSTTLDLRDIRILLVDDTPLNLKVASKLLEKYNANHVVTSSSGFDCLDRINRGEVYDVILLDDMMPKMSGVETLKKLKENPNFKTPTVALTANAITGMREKYLADGFDDYLAKPIERDQLIRVMNQVLGRSATEEINVSEVVTNNENIRSEEIPNVEDQEKAEAEREENTEPDIIPVEDNIEEVLGDQLDMNYREKTSIDLKPVKIDHIDGVDIKEEVPSVVSVNPQPKFVETPTEPVVQPVVSTEPVQIIPVQPVMVQTIPVVEVATTPQVANTFDRSYLEANGVDVNHGLELLGDMEMYNMTMSDFMSGVEDKWAKIVQYRNEQNMPDYAIEVHSLKSDCKYLGFMKLADVAYEHELKSKENDSNFVNDNFERLETEYRKVLDIAKTYAEHNKVEG
jgi:signal transduction histidine kinase/DNA-binding response OmpR family regulator/HPt (histidine-containing phosphotransfer) domain-containing protein